MVGLSWYVAPGLPERALKRILKPLIEIEEDKAKRIINLVVQEFGISHYELMSKCRKRYIVLPRQVAMSLISNYTNLTLKNIGKLFGGRDHSTVLYAIDTVQNLCDTDKYFKAIYIKLQSKI